MAPSASIHRVVLDANVLYPASLRDLLLRCAEKELYRLQLSQDIWSVDTHGVLSLCGAARTGPDSHVGTGHPMTTSPLTRRRVRAVSAAGMVRAMSRGVLGFR